MVYWDSNALKTVSGSTNLNGQVDLHRMIVWSSESLTHYVGGSSVKGPQVFHKGDSKLVEIYSKFLRVKWSIWNRASSESILPILHRRSFGNLQWKFSRSELDAKTSTYHQELFNPKCSLLFSRETVLKKTKISSLVFNENFSFQPWYALCYSNRSLV